MNDAVVLVDEAGNRTFTLKRHAGELVLVVEGGSRRLKAQPHRRPWRLVARPAEVPGLLAAADRASRLPASYADCGPIRLGGVTWRARVLVDSSCARAPRPGVLRLEPPAGTRSGSPTFRGDHLHILRAALAALVGRPLACRPGGRTE